MYPRCERLFTLDVRFIIHRVYEMGIREVVETYIGTEFLNHLYNFRHAVIIIFFIFIHVYKERFWLNWMENIVNRIYISSILISMKTLCHFIVRIFTIFTRLLEVSYKLYSLKNVKKSCVCIGILLLFLCGFQLTLWQMLSAVPKTPTQTKSNENYALIYSTSPSGILMLICLQQVIGDEKWYWKGHMEVV